MKNKYQTADVEMQRGKKGEMRRKLELKQKLQSKGVKYPNILAEDLKPAANLSGEKDDKQHRMMHQGGRSQKLLTPSKGRPLVTLVVAADSNEESKSNAPTVILDEYKHQTMAAPAS